MSHLFFYLKHLSMGALTLKQYPFELRNWESEVFSSFDPTDSFGSAVKIYVSESRILQVEPNHDNYNENKWLSDKGRQFFKEIFQEVSPITEKQWSKLLCGMTKTLYMFDHCRHQKSDHCFFKIVFGNLSIEVLSLLIILSQNYSFVSLRRAERAKSDIDLETMFQLNFGLEANRLASSTICLLISTNPRYEGYSLSAKLRQRMLKGNFKCLIVGSLVNLNFPITFLGSNFNIVKNIAEGNNFMCQDLKNSQNPLLIYNNELFKRRDSKNTQKTLQMLHYLNIFSKTWDGLDILNPTLSATGIFNLKQFTPFSKKDLNNFSSFYFLNVTATNIPLMKEILKTNMTDKFFNRRFWKTTTIINQNNKCMKDLLSLSKKVGVQWWRRSITDFNYLRVPQTNFFEKDETYISTEGIIKKTVQVIPNTKIRTSWHIFKIFLKHFKEKLTFLKQNKTNKKIFFDSNELGEFRNFLNFHYYATRTLTYINWFLNLANKPFFFNTFKRIFKFKMKKIYNTKLKYWLHDFFIGGKDEYSSYSKVLATCSKISKDKSTIFFQI